MPNGGRSGTGRIQADGPRAVSPERAQQGKVVADADAQLVRQLPTGLAFGQQSAEECAHGVVVELTRKRKGMRKRWPLQAYPSCVIFELEAGTGVAQQSG